jgi:hypothetical protein
MSRSLPDINEASFYAVDLAATMTMYINFEILGVKIKSSQGKETWNRLAPVLSFALALRDLAEVTQTQCVVSSVDADYLRSQIDGLVPGLGEIIVRDVASRGVPDSEVLPKVARLIESLVETIGGSFGRKAKDPLRRLAAISTEVQSGLPAVSVLWPFMSSTDASEILKPINGPNPK